jgi:hypothetical protein
MNVSGAHRQGARLLTSEGGRFMASATAARADRDPSAGRRRSRRVDRPSGPREGRNKTFIFINKYLRAARDLRRRVARCALLRRQIDKGARVDVGSRFVYGGRLRSFQTSP